jgi:hypothetical protein
MIDKSRETPGPLATAVAALAGLLVVSLVLVCSGGGAALLLVGMSLITWRVSRRVSADLDSGIDEGGQLENV